MPGAIVHVGAGIICPHGASVSVVTSNTRVLLGGQPAATLADTYPVAGCPFQVPVGAGTKPQPCVTARWLVPATRVLVNSQPVILQTSTGLCQSVEQIPQGPPTVVAAQPRVVAT
jgi:hypothetical protein